MFHNKAITKNLLMERAGLTLNEEKTFVEEVEDAIAVEFPDFPANDHEEAVAKDILDMAERRAIEGGTPADYVEEFSFRIADTDLDEEVEEGAHEVEEEVEEGTFGKVKKKLGMSKIVRPTDADFDAAHKHIEDNYPEGYTLMSIGVDAIQDKINIEVGDFHGESEDIVIDRPLVNEATGDESEMISDVDDLNDTGVDEIRDFMEAHCSISELEQIYEILQEMMKRVAEQSKEDGKRYAKLANKMARARK